MLNNNNFKKNKKYCTYKTQSYKVKILQQLIN